MTRDKIEISPGQGLLILIDHYQNDDSKIAQLKKLYLSGGNTAEAKETIKSLLLDPALNSYKVSFEETTINNDPTRRYFETHLAYESVNRGLKYIELEDIQKHYNLLADPIPPDDRPDIYKVLSGIQDNNIPNKDFVNLYTEYTNYIKKLASKEIFANLSENDREKLLLIVKIAFLGVIHAESSDDSLPLNIYHNGIYDAKNRGIKKISDQETTRNQHLGLMKNYMPIPSNDIAMSDKPVPYTKPSDRSSFETDALWVKSNFDTMVHPFVNSISGTMLCQLRLHKFFENEGKGVFTNSAERLAQFSQLLASALMFNSGGHSLHEFTAPLTLEEVRKAFVTIPGFDNIDLESMYLTHNKEAFDAALHDAVKYNKIMLMKQRLHANIKNSEIEFFPKPI